MAELSPQVVRFANLIGRATGERPEALLAAAVDNLPRALEQLAATLGVTVDELSHPEVRERAMIVVDAAVTRQQGRLLAVMVALREEASE